MVFVIFNYFKKMGSKINPYDRCVANKTINYKQGHLIVQNKNFVHRAGSSQFTSGPRITLQGNIAIKKDKAFIYW